MPNPYDVFDSDSTSATQQVVADNPYNQFDSKESPVQKMNETEEDNARQLAALAPKRQGPLEYFMRKDNPLNLMNAPGYFIQGAENAAAAIGNLPEVARRGLPFGDYPKQLIDFAESVLNSTGKIPPFPTPTAKPSTEEVFGANPQTQPIPLPYAPGAPTAPIYLANEDIDPVNKVVGETIRGASTPGMILGAPFLGTKPAQALFLSQTVPGAVENVEQAIQAPTAEGRLEHGARAGIDTLFSILLGKHLGKGEPPSGLVDKDITFGPTPVTDPQMFGLPENRAQIAPNTYSPPQPGQPFGGAGFAGTTRGDVLPLEQLTPKEQMELARGVGANVYQPREERVRPAQAPAQVVGGQPDWLIDAMKQRGLDPNRPFNDIDIQNPSVRAAIQSDPTLTPEQKARALATGSIEPAYQAAGEPTQGGQISFASEAQAGGIPSARQQAVSPEAFGGSEQPPDVVAKVVEVVNNPDRLTLEQKLKEFQAEPGAGLAEGSRGDLIRLTEARLKELATGQLNPELNTLRRIVKPGEVKPTPEAVVTDLGQKQLKGPQGLLSVGEAFERAEKEQKPIVPQEGQGKVAEPIEGQQPAMSADPFMMLDPEFWKGLGLKQGDAGQFYNRIRNKLGEGSQTWEMVKDLLPKAGRVTQEEVRKMVEEGEGRTRVEVHAYGMEGKVSEAAKKHAELTHSFYDQLETSRKRDMDRVVRGDLDLDSLLQRTGFIGDDARIQQARDYVTAAKQVLKEPLAKDVPRATSAYDTVSAFPTSEPMPDWTKSKEGKNVQRVDVVVPIEYKPGRIKWKEKGMTEEGQVPSNIMWPPDSIHENLPNTLGWAMIQYKTGPKGEKIAVIGEAQSRWGQEMRELQKADKEAEARGERSPRSKPRVQDHPLLRDYNRLIVKAAIDQARKENATHIVLPDAETAMMSEGHDLAARAVQVAAYSRDSAIRTARLRSDEINDARAEQLITREVREGSWEVSLINQEPGMRLNYDTLLPRIAEELTGGKGEKVSLGEHKNAIELRHRIMDQIDTEKWAIEEQKVHQADDLNGKYTIVKVGDRNWALYREDSPRKNLIFRNPDSSPKTDVSGLMYPLKDVREKFTLTGKDKAVAKEGKVAEPIPELGGETELQAGLSLTQQAKDTAKGFVKNIEETVKDTLPRVVFGPGTKDVSIHERVAARMGALRRESAPLTTAASEETGNKLIRFASAQAAGRAEGRALASEALGKNVGDAKFDEKIAGVIVEGQLRGLRQRLTLSGKAAEAQKVVSTIGRESPFKTEAEYQLALKDPEVKKTLDFHKSQIQSKVEKQHTDLGGKTRGGDPTTGVFANLMAAFDLPDATAAKAYVGGRQAAELTNPLKRPSVFSKQFRGTAEKYVMSYRQMVERMVAGNYEEVTYRNLINSYIDSGLGQVEKPGVVRPKIGGEPAERVTIERRGTPWGSTKVENLWVRKDLANEFRQALNTDSKLSKTAMGEIAHLITRIQTSLGVDAVWHSANLFSAVDSAIRTETGKNVFGAREVDSVTRVVQKINKVLSDTPEIQREIANLSRIGAWHDKPSTGIGGPGARFINLVDKAGRLVLNDLYKELVDAGYVKESEKGKREFINKMGQYNPKLMSQYQRFFRETGLSPFVVAGRNFNSLAMQKLFVSPGVKAAGYKEAAKLRGQALIGLLTAGVVMPALINSITTGKPFGRAGVPTGAIDTGQDDKKGNPIVIDPLKYLLVRRGMRITGLGALERDVRRGEVSKKTASDAASDIMNGLIHPWTGPAVDAASVFKSGRDVSGYQIAPEPKSLKSRSISALEEFNPLIGGVSKGMAEGDVVGKVGQQFSGALGVKTSPLSWQERLDKMSLQETGKTYQETPLFKRASVLEKIKQSKATKTEAQKLQSSIYAMELSAEEKDKFLGDLPKDVTKWAKDKGLNIPGYETSLNVNGKQIALVREEREILHEEMVKAYERVFKMNMKNVPNPSQANVNNWASSAKYGAVARTKQRLTASQKEKK